MTIAQDMIESAKSGDMTGLKAALVRGASVDTADENTNTALFWAAHNGHAEAVSFLIGQGADINRGNSNGSTPLMGAAEQGKGAAVAILVAAGADRTRKNNSSYTADKFAQTHNHGSVDALIAKASEVTYSYPVDNRTLQEIFNFERRERITLIRNGEQGPVEAVSRQSFSELADKSALQKAFDEYKRRGGPREAEEIFHDSLPKAKLQLKLKEM